MITRKKAITFDPSSPLEEDEEHELTAADDQANLMYWHYHLCHLLFAKLKLLAKMVRSHNLAKDSAAKCMVCLFGTMTKMPWQGKESKSSHEVFIPTKPGECIRVNQIVSYLI